MSRWREWLEEALEDADRDGVRVVLVAVGCAACDTLHAPDDLDDAALCQRCRRGAALEFYMACGSALVVLAVVLVATSGWWL